MSALLLLLAVQAGMPSVTATVDRTRLAVGEELLLTVRASGAADQPIRISLPPLDGFEVTARSERTEVAFAATDSRTTTLEVRLRPTRAGTFRLGPISAQQGASTVRTAAVTVSVTGSAGPAVVTPRLRSLLERAPPPRRPGEPALSLIASDTRIYVGEQVDVITAAWFPRDLRARLRRPPTLSPPSLTGVWSYPQPTPPGISASRQVGGTWYDLFVSHQVVFPLVAGRVEIARASLQYSVPVAMQFFSQEERYTLESNDVVLDVLPLPATGRPATFAGAVGRGITIERTAPRTARSGEAVPIEVVVRGAGNVALWPVPDLRWPDGVRQYQDRTDDRIETTAGRLGGEKRFRFLAIPDSAGPVTLPAVEYPYFDLDAEAYRVARAPAVTFVVAPGAESATSRPTPPPLIERRSAPLASRALGALPAPVWIGITLLPLLAWGGLEARDRARDRRRRRKTDLRPDLAASGRRLLMALRNLVSDAETRTGTELVAALRASGVEVPLAQRIARVRDEFLATRYGPAPASGRTEAEITREMDELTRALGGQSRHRERRGRQVALTIALALLLPALAAAQLSPERLYADGAYRAAAEAFARRAATEPAVAAHWYGLGAAEYRAGSDARASAAWQRAARIAPRAPSVRRALRLVPPPDPVSARRFWVSPVSPAELALAGLAAWLAGWGLIYRNRRRPRLRYLALLATGLALGLAALGVELQYRRPLAVAVRPVPLRISPHERADEIGPTENGTALRPVRRDGAWVLAEASPGRLGWLPADALVFVSE
ncbi:MAG TPA: BatD family protein [Gemmatimonadales bacterium]|nr:BatD family protein [Gemmatimonadales bacterium]